MNEINHISQEDIYKFQHNLLRTEDMEHFLEHISSCDYCSGQLSECMEKEMIAAPVDLKQNILKATKRPEVQFVVKAKETSKKVQLLLYSLKVGTAAIGALIILMLVMNINPPSSVPDLSEDISNHNDNSFSLTATIRDNMNTLSDNILDFSNTIMKTEVNDYDQKEK